jgi:transcriptional regulator with XRE-family HTH domain
VASLAERFGRAVRAERIRQGLSQEGLAELAGVDRTYISGLERGRRNPALSTVERIAEALRAESWQLLHAQARPPAPSADILPTNLSADTGSGHQEAAR